MKFRTAISTILFVFLVMGSVVAQEETEKKDKPGVDPTSASDMFKDTVGKIRNVEQLDKFIKENTQLKTANATLTAQVKANAAASAAQVKTLNGTINTLTQQVNKLTQDLATQDARIRKQLLELPSFVVKSKLVRGEDSIAILQFGEKSIRIRNKLELSVPVKDGVWINMKVEGIEREFITLSFPELERTLLIYD